MIPVRTFERLLRSVTKTFTDYFKVHAVVTIERETQIRFWKRQIVNFFIIRMIDLTQMCAFSNEQDHLASKRRSATGTAKSTKFTIQKQKNQWYQRKSRRLRLTEHHSFKLEEASAAGNNRNCSQNVDSEASQGLILDLWRVVMVMVVVKINIDWYEMEKQNVAHRCRGKLLMKVNMMMLK